MATTEIVLRGMFLKYKNDMKKTLEKQYLSYLERLNK